MSKGVLVYARNNDYIDYTKQAYHLALRIKQFLDLPVSIVTDSIPYIKKAGYDKAFDQLIPIDSKETYRKLSRDRKPRPTWNKDSGTGDEHLIMLDHNSSNRRYYDGTLSNKVLPFRNGLRSAAYHITPYDETLLLDTDLVIMDDLYKHCFTHDHDLLMYSNSYDLAGFRDPFEFKYISPTSVKFYWATAVFFRKTPENKIFFELVQHIQENWYHYRTIFQISASLYRNDFAFSIAAHIMNGYQDSNFVHEMPGKLFFTTDRDILWELRDDHAIFLLEKDDYVGEYTLCAWKDRTIHVMNKFSLERVYDGVGHE